MIFGKPRRRKEKEQKEIKLKCNLAEVMVSESILRFMKYFSVFFVFGILARRNNSLNSRFESVNNVSQSILKAFLLSMPCLDALNHIHRSHKIKLLSANSVAKELLCKYLSSSIELMTAIHARR